MSKSPPSSLAVPPLNHFHKPLQAINPKFKLKKKKQKIEKIRFALVFLDFSLPALEFSIFRPQIWIPCKKNCIYSQILVKNHEFSYKSIKNTNLNVGLPGLTGRLCRACARFSYGFEDFLEVFVGLR